MKANVNDRCTCGNHVDDDHNKQKNKQEQKYRSDDNHINNNNSNNNNNLDYSFVHLPSSLQSSFYPHARSNKLHDGHNPSMNNMNIHNIKNNNNYSNHNNIHHRRDLYYNHGLVRANEYMDHILQLTQLCLLDDDIDTTKISEHDNDLENNLLCNDCIERIASAIHKNTEQLNRESQSYLNAIEEYRDDEKRLIKALSIHSGINPNNNNSNNDSIDNNSILPNPNSTTTQNDTTTTTNDQNHQLLLQQHIQFYQYERTTLLQNCFDLEQELQTIHTLLSQQILLHESLHHQEQNLFSNYNNIEFDAQIFEQSHNLQLHHAYTAEREVAALSRVNLHSTIFTISIDTERGLRYPLLNNLRLSHRPKGDLSWEELNAAWSQAAQLVMFVGSVIQFKSRNLRIVPLSCAKIIEFVTPPTTATSSGSNGNVSGTIQNRVYHLGLDLDSSNRGHSKNTTTTNIVRSVKAFHALLEQIISFLKMKHDSEKNYHGRDDDDVDDDDYYVTDTHTIPFDIAPGRIGNFDLTKLQAHDDASWSGVILCMASNMKWLAENACYYSAE